ncbi:hypothetical protein ANN_14467 [Periplaneta americana]|uniref:Uncharacterized protein n=1 Tax=Periplaneta americana TaxID=6978 RepID=A0ABQ8SWD7_PERAM|nr:hypothetical protein ANN_14467 [Periplaneta americana]
MMGLCEGGNIPRGSLKAIIRDWLNGIVHDRWIGRKGPNDRACFAWPPRSPDLTQCDFYLWGFIKDRVYVPPLPADLPDLRQRIEAVVATITPDTLIKVREELSYRLDVCRVTNGALVQLFEPVFGQLTKQQYGDVGAAIKKRQAKALHGFSIIFVCRLRIGNGTRNTEDSDASIRQRKQG